MKYRAKDMIVSVIGIAIIAFGVSFIVKASIGIDPWGIFFNAMQMTYMTFKPQFMPSLLFGDSIMIVSCFLVLIASCMLREKIKWLSIIGGVLLGQFVNAWSFFLQYLHVPSAWFSIGGIALDGVNFLLLLIGILILSLGVAITIHFPFILTPVDYLMYALDIKIPFISYGLIRVFSDISISTVGVLMILSLTGDFGKTRIGVGTVVMLLITGLIIDKMQQMVGSYNKSKM